MRSPSLEQVVRHMTGTESTAGHLAERVPVRFEGDRTGAGELSWGQHEYWRTMHAQQTSIPVGKVNPLPAGATLGDEVAGLRFAMSNYPTMRTRLRFDPGRDRARPIQVVAGTGETCLEVVDADPDVDPRAVADQVWWGYRRGDLDLTTEWPVRMAVVRQRGQLTHRVWVMSHLVTDGFGAKVYADERDARDASGSRAAPPPLAQARWQASPAGQRQCQVALRYWEKLLRGVSSRRFPQPTEKPRPRYWQARFTSPALLLAARAVAARTGVEISSVLLALFATALARATGVNPVVPVVNVSNRFRPGLAHTVSPIMHSNVCLLDLPDGTLDEAVRHTRRRAMAAYKHAYYDPLRREELIARVNQDRGEVDIGCMFNDRRIAHREAAGPPPAPERIRAALAGTCFKWQHQQDEVEFEKLTVNVDDVPDQVQLTVPVDTHYLAPGQVEASIRGMEEVAVAAALDPATRTQVPAAQTAG